MSVFSFHRPDKVLMVESSDFFGKFELKPLEPGYGITIGNALRRVLLSSLEGYAISSIKLEGVEHEFSSINGVIEDVTDIILNLKRVRFKSNIESKQGAPYEETVKISLSDSDSFKAGDIEKFTPNFSVINKDLVICSMDKNTKLDIKLVIKKGRGFVLSDDNSVDNKELGVIFMDTIHTPIKNVSFKIDNYRIGQRTDYEKLVLEITSDGSINPKEALTKAATVLVEHFMLCSEEKIVIEEDREVLRRDKIDEGDILLDHLLNTRLDDMDVSVRALNCLKSAEIATLGELVVYKKEDLIKFRNFGKKSLDELQHLLESKGLHFGMNIHKKK